MEFRKRLLVVLMAVSLVVIFDVFANGSLVVLRMAASMIRTSSPSVGPFIEEQAPFLAKRGSLAESSVGVRRVVVRGVDDIAVTRATEPEVSLEYEIRTYAVSSRHAQSYHDQASVRLERAGDTLIVALDRPEGGADLLGVRAAYAMSVPDGVALELEDVTGSASLHQVTGPLTVRRAGGSVTVTEHAGDIRVEDATGATWLAGVQGDVDIRHLRGRVELIDIDGGVTVSGEQTSVLAETIQGDMTVSVDRGVGLFYSVAGDLTASATMAHVTANGIGGALELTAAMSPVELGPAVGRASLTTTGANVRLAVDGTSGRSLDVRVERGDIVTDLPLDVAQEERGVKRLVGTLGPGGGPELLVRATGGDVTIEGL